MAHDHRMRSVGRPWMHSVEDMRKQGRTRIWTLTGEEADLDKEDLEGFSVYKPVDDDDK